jgi:multidrug efflux pump subunit AcrB
MTSLTAFLGLLPLAYGVGAGADMLRPLAVGVIGALCMSLLLSLVATPVVYYILVRIFAPQVLRVPAAVQANPGSPS